MAKYKVVIVGGGFGGVKTALLLARHHNLEVTLIYDHPDFRYYPKLFETATGGKKTISSIPIAEIFKALPINLVQDSVIEIDRHGHSITTQTNKTFNYDALVLGFGVRTNYFGIAGLDKFSFGIKSLEDAEKFKNHLHQQVIDEHKPDLNYVIVGGGPTGIELAGVLPHYVKKILKHHGIEPRQLHIDLVEAAPRLLPRAPKDISKRVKRHLRKMGIKLYLNTAVQAETADALMINNKPIRSHTVVWTAGMSNHPFFAEQNFQMSTRGKVRVDQYLQAEPGIYVIGDNADTPYSGMAQTALHDGKFVANNIIRLLEKKKLKTYTAKEPVYIYAAGANWSAVQWGSIHLFGRVGSVLRKLADLDGYHSFEPWNHAIGRFTETYQEEEACPICATQLTNS